MSTDITLVIQFYWEGKIAKIGGSFTYYPMRCKKAILVKDRIGYDVLVDRVYTCMELDRNVFNLNL